MNRPRQFASDTYAGICPEAWAAMEEANAGHERSYGDDKWTEEASNLIRDVFETDCEVFFAFNGTATAGERRSIRVTGARGVDDCDPS